MGTDIWIISGINGECLSLTHLYIVGIIGLVLGYFTCMLYLTAKRPSSKTPLSKSGKEKVDAESEDDEEFDDDIERVKMVLVVRVDLEMGKGKAAAQCCHACLAAYETSLNRRSKFMKAWKYNGQPKVTLKCGSEAEMLELESKAKSMGIVAESICDAGRTQIPAGSRTVLALGPDTKIILLMMDFMTIEDGNEDDSIEVLIKAFTEHSIDSDICLNQLSQFLSIQRLERVHQKWWTLFLRVLDHQSDVDRTCSLMFESMPLFESVNIPSTGLNQLYVWFHDDRHSKASLILLKIVGKLDITRPLLFDKELVNKYILLVLDNDDIWTTKTNVLCSITAFVMSIRTEHVSEKMIELCWKMLRRTLSGAEFELGDYAFPLFEHVYSSYPRQLLDYIFNHQEHIETPDKFYAFLLSFRLHPSLVSKSYPSHLVHPLRITNEALVDVPQSPMREYSVHERDSREYFDYLKQKVRILESVNRNLLDEKSEAILVLNAQQQLYQEYRNQKKELAAIQQSYAKLQLELKQAKERHLKWEAALNEKLKAARDARMEMKKEVDKAVDELEKMKDICAGLVKERNELEQKLAVNRLSKSANKEA